MRQQIHKRLFYALDVVQTYPRGVNKRNLNQFFCALTRVQGEKKQLFEISLGRKFSSLNLILSKKILKENFVVNKF